METRLLVAPDDKAVPLGINVNEEFKRMPGLWKFNNTLRQVLFANDKRLLSTYFAEIR